MTQTHERAVGMKRNAIWGYSMLNTPSKTGNAGKPMKHHAHIMTVLFSKNDRFGYSCHGQKHTENTIMATHHTWDTHTYDD